MQSYSGYVHCRASSLGLVKYLWSNSYSVALAAQQSEYYARGCSIRYLLYVQQSAMVLYDRNSQYWGKYLCFRLSFFLTFFPITCDNVFAFSMLFFGRKKYWFFFSKRNKLRQASDLRNIFRGLSELFQPSQNLARKYNLFARQLAALGSQFLVEICSRWNQLYLKCARNRMCKIWNVHK